MTSLLSVCALVAAWGYVAGVTVLARRFARRLRLARAGDRGPPVSVLKPLHGAEPGLRDNLRSCADQDYPDFQLVLGVRDRADGALPAARALLAERPGCDIELVIDPR